LIGAYASTGTYCWGYFGILCPDELKTVWSGTILAFIGFEAAARLGEEARNPRRAVPIAVLTSVAVGGVVYVVAYYAATVFIGPSHMLDFINSNGGNLWGGLGTAGWGAAGILIILVLLNSLLACANGAGNSGSRMLFSLGRVGGLPASFANIDKKRGTPYLAIRVISISGIIIAVGLGFIIGGPLNVFAVYATAITILFVVGYMLVAVSCIRYSIREPEKSGNFLLRYVVPACAFLVFVPVLLASLGIPFLGLAIAQPEAMRRMTTVFEKDTPTTETQALQEP
jgi:amino acid transporter